MSHTINHLSFGNPIDVHNIKSLFKHKENTINTLDGSRKQTGQGFKNNYEYYMKVIHLIFNIIKIIPTNYIYIDGTSFSLYQMSPSEHEYKTIYDIPAIFFRYDISPAFVRYQQYRRPAFHFFVHLCAIVGGIFSVVGLLDAILNKCCTC